MKRTKSPGESSLRKAMRVQETEVSHESAPICDFDVQSILEAREKELRISSASDIDSDDMSSLSGLGFKRLYGEYDVKGAEMERKRQGRRQREKKTPEIVNKLFDLEQDIRNIQFPPPDTCKSKNLRSLQERLEALAREAKNLTMEKKKEEELVSKFGILPGWIDRNMEPWVGLGLTDLEAACNASEHATAFILTFLDKKKISDEWRWGRDCNCEAYYPEYERGECPCGDSDCDPGSCDCIEPEDPDCTCAEKFMSSSTRGYLSIAVYMPMLELIRFANKQKKNLREEILLGCRKTLKSKLDGIKRTQKNKLVVKVLKYLLDEVNGNEKDEGEHDSEYELVFGDKNGKYHKTKDIFDDESSDSSGNGNDY